MGVALMVPDTSADGSGRTLPKEKGKLYPLRGHFSRGNESHQDWPATEGEVFLSELWGGQPLDWQGCGRSTVASLGKPAHALRPLGPGGSFSR